MVASSSFCLNRYNWSAVLQTALLRMPNLMHALPGGWLSQQVERLNNALVPVARCGQPHLSTGISGDITLPNGTPMQPDQQLLLALHFENGQSLGIPRPRVVLETAFSQRLEQAIVKAWQYLHLFDGDIHAVIICNISNPITLQRNFKAEFYVWVREKTGNIGKSFNHILNLTHHLSTDEEFPLEKLNEVYHESTHKPSSNAEDANTVETESSDRSSWGNSTLASDEATKVDRPEDLQLYAPSNESKKIWRRSETSIVR